MGKIPWRRAWQPTPVFLPGEAHGQRSLEGGVGLQSLGSQRVDTSEATEQNPREYVLRRNGKVEILVCMNDIDHSSPFYIGGLRIRLN